MSSPASSLLTKFLSHLQIFSPFLEALPAHSSLRRARRPPRPDDRPSARRPPLPTRAEGLQNLRRPLSPRSVAALPSAAPRRARRPRPTTTARLDPPFSSFLFSPLSPAHFSLRCAAQRPTLAPSAAPRSTTTGAARRLSSVVLTGRERS
ncbi:hypothetical protein BT93_D1957 [Corymbia citriodora subsp. variegata]|nr:hypothetical protein BT93_D1957 [Corymbia citriodora subsp. variegata]